MNFSAYSKGHIPSGLQASASILFIAMWFQHKLKQSYTTSLWGAAFAIMGGCSDDGFEYFRGWLIAQGEEVFNRVIKEPEFLADYLSDEHLEEDEFAPQMEEMLKVAVDAYTYGKLEYDEDVADQFWETLEAKGYEYELPALDLDWNEDNLEEKYPVLWENFRDSPLT